MANYFYIQPLSKAVTQIENTVDSAIAEAQKSDGAKSVLKTELENLRHEIAKIERAIAKIERENASGKSAGV